MSSSGASARLIAGKGKSGGQASIQEQVSRGEQDQPAAAAAYRNYTSRLASPSFSETVRQDLPSLDRRSNTRNPGESRNVLFLRQYN